MFHQALGKTRSRQAIRPRIEPVIELSTDSTESSHERWPCFLALTLASPLAHAHGEEILTSIFAELTSVVLCLVFLFLHPRAKPYRGIGFFACVAGVVTENWVLADLLYMQYRHLITVAGLIAPPTSVLLAVYFKKRLIKKNDEFS